MPTISKDILNHISKHTVSLLGFFYFICDATEQVVQLFFLSFVFVVPCSNHIQQLPSPSPSPYCLWLVVAPIYAVALIYTIIAILVPVSIFPHANN